jgi:hypothetical protein
MRLFILILVGSLLLPIPVRATDQPSKDQRSKDQCDKAGLDNPTWDQESGQLSVSFKVPITTPLSGDDVLWSVFDQTDGKAAAIDPGTIIYDRTSSNPSTESTSAAFPVSLDKSHQYLISVVKLKFAQCLDFTSASAFAKIAIKQARAVPAKPPESTAKEFAISAAKGRDDADLYLAGLINGAEGTKAAYTADIKAQFRYLLTPASSGGADNKFRPGIWFVPNFNLTASTNPQADGNSVTMGVAFPFGLPLNNKTFTWVDIEPAVQGESDKQFRDINTIFRLRSYFLMRVFGSGRLQLLPQPFLGFETGGNARSPVPGAYPGGIARPNAGVHMYFNFFKSSKPGRQAFIESEYIRRWPLLGEPIFSQTSSGALVLSSVGTSPRDYVTTKAEYDFEDYFGITLQHDYGMLPPVFNKVNNKYTIGLVLKTGLVYKPK